MLHVIICSKYRTWEHSIRESVTIETINQNTDTYDEDLIYV